MRIAIALVVRDIESKKYGNGPLSVLIWSGGNYMKIEKVVDFVIGITIIALVLYLLLSIYVVYKAVNDTNDAIMAGIIGFVGAIIGGYLTWRGVKVSVEHQKEKDRLEKLPGILKNCWKIQSRYIAFGTVLAMNLSKNKSNISIDAVNQKVDEFYNTTDEEATDLALDVSPEMYQLILSYYTHISDFRVYYNRGEVVSYSNKLYDFGEQFNDMLFSYAKEYEILSNRLKVEV